jgi:site-specific recombinase XerD
MLLTDYRTNKRRSLDRVERSLKHLREKFGGEVRDREGNLVRKVTPWLALNITTDQIQEYISERQARKAQNASINRELAALKRMFRLAVRARKVRDVPYVPMLREDNTRTGFFEPAEFDAILEHLPRDLKPVFTMAYLTGWRVRSEILTRQ